MGIVCGTDEHKNITKSPSVSSMSLLEILPEYKPKKYKLIEHKTKTFQDEIKKGVEVEQLDKKIIQDLFIFEYNKQQIIKKKGK